MKTIRIACSTCSQPARGHPGAPFVLQRSVRCQAGEQRRREVPAESDEAEGVKALLKRDRRDVELPEVDPFAEEGPVGSSEPPKPLEPPPAGRQAVQARTQVIRDQQDAETRQKTKTGPRTASAAIEQGIAVLQAGEAEDAIALFQQALDLPGRGSFRLKGSAKEYSCASEGEEVAALYNLACAYVACGKPDAALASIEGAIETGFEDWEVLRSDPDLASIQGPDLERLVRKATGEGIWNVLNVFRRKG